MRIARREMPEITQGTSEAAEYLADMTGSLAGLARRHGLNTLAYILEMAREEAENHVRSRGPDREPR